MEHAGKVLSQNEGNYQGIHPMNIINKTLTNGELITLLNLTTSALKHC